VLQCVAVSCSELQYISATYLIGVYIVESRSHLSTDECVAECCSVLQCVVVCCSELQCAAVCCSELQCAAVCHSNTSHWGVHTVESRWHLSMRPSFAGSSCSVLQCVAMCCGVLQCVAV